MTDTTRYAPKNSDGDMRIAHALATQALRQEDAAQREPISAEAQALGIPFCCGKDERQAGEIAKLRNVVQAAMFTGNPKVFEAWNYHFPDDQRPVPQEAQSPQADDAEWLKEHESLAVLYGNSCWARAEDAAVQSDLKSLMAHAAQRHVCQTCNGVGLIGGHSGQTPESYQEHSEDCPDCTPQRPTESQILEAAQYAGLWPNTVSRWIPAFHRYHEALNSMMAAQRPAEPAITSRAVPAPVSGVLAEVRRERQRQDAKWGGAAHDDSHTTEEFAEFIEARAYKVRALDRSDREKPLTYGCMETPRQILLEISALAVAAIESIDRKGGA